MTFTAHYDASGSEGDRAGLLVVVGLLAHEYKWLRFEQEWQAVLDRFEVPYFHRKELGARHKGTGAYAKWCGDDDTPKKFVRGLLKVLRRQINKTFCYGMVLDDYASINKRYRLRESLGSPYVLTAGSCYDAINRWGRRKYPKAQQCLHIFEEGDCGQRDFLKLAKRLGHRPHTKPKFDKTTGEWFIPFQGADLVAGAWRRAGNMRGKVQSFDDYGEEFNELASTLAQQAKVHDRRTLLAGCKANPDTCPPR